MDELLNKNPSTKRLLVGVGAMLAAGMSQRLGISENLAFGILALAGTMIGTSNWKEAAIAGANAAAKIGSTPDAAAELSKP